ncbi:MAG: cytochrome c oxidase subunit II [Thermodesulfobacteriota bacterium]
MSWLPEAASNFAERVDNVLIFITVISLIFFILITACLVYFSIKYRKKSDDDETPYITGNETLEIIWTLVPSVLLIIIFIWAFLVYKDMRTPPKDAIEINVVARQWLWQFEYGNGLKTINELYLQKNRPVRLVMRAEDVIHSFFVPAFRVKQDILPGRYTQLWFTPTKIGTFNLFCAEYCGTGHSAMLARVNVLSPESYDRWAKGDEVEDTIIGVQGLSLSEKGEKLYKERGCNACHSIDGSVLVGPSFKGLFGRKGEFQDGSKYKADENYIRNSILNPQGQIVQGYQPVMPSYKGILSGDDVTAIIEYMKTLK